MKGVHTISLHEHPIVFRSLLLPETTSGSSSDNEVIKYNDKLKIEYSIENNVAIVENNDYIMKIIRLLRGVYGGFILKSKATWVISSSSFSPSEPPLVFFSWV